MRSKDYLWNICMNIYREMYREATPSADFDELIETGEASRDGFFMNYYLPMEKQEEIVNKYLRKHKCSRIESSIIRETVYLGCSPTSVKPESES